MIRLYTRAAAILAIVSLGGCYSIAHEERVRRIQISTSPQGALVWEKEALAPLGYAPVVLEKRYVAAIRHFRKWLWFMPAVSTAGIGSAIWMTVASTEGSRLRSGAAVLGGLSFVAGLATLLVCILGNAEDHKVASATPEMVTVIVQLPGRPRQEHPITLNPRRGSAEVTLLAMPIRPGAKPPFPRLQRATRVAVFDVEDLTGRLTGGELEQLTTHLADRVLRQSLLVVPLGVLRRHAAQAGSGVLKCYAGTCQQEAAYLAHAFRVLATKVRLIDGRCVITSTLYPKYGSTAEGSASTRAECTTQSLRQGMERIAAYLITE